ncbi:MAG: transcription antitermination factor NusB [Gemmatimonadaceae bacterium]
MADVRDDAFWDAPTQEPLAPARGRRTPRSATKTERMETRGRARALQALYAADLRDLAQLRRIATTVFDDLAIDPEERQFASRLVATVADRGAELDAALSEVTANWRLERLGAIERSVLRLAAAEMARNDAPVKVVLQEAVHLAVRYGTSRGARFVNGVLDAYARRLGLL